MQDWSKFIEQNYKEDVLPGLLAEGYRVVEDELGICDYRNILLRKGDISIELLCDCDREEFERLDKAEEEHSMDDLDWWVIDVFENGESYNEFSESECFGNKPKKTAQKTRKNLV